MSDKDPLFQGDIQGSKLGGSHVDDSIEQLTYVRQVRSRFVPRDLEKSSKQWPLQLNGLRMDHVSTPLEQALSQSRIFH